jgi:uncharacterized membrane protein YeaQ/YmgE (transglycosylase-associated protein family)
METVVAILIFLVIGGLAGWLAATLVRGRGMGILGNILLGIIGALIGGLIFRWLDVGGEGGLIWSFFAAVVGAIILLLIVRFIKRM